MSVNVSQWHQRPSSVLLPRVFASAIIQRITLNFNHPICLNSFLKQPTCIGKVIERNMILPTSIQRFLVAQFSPKYKAGATML